MPKIIGESIDLLCNIEMRPSEGDLPRGITRKYYMAARQVQKDPLSYLAAKALIERVKPGDKVLIVTGVRYPPILPFGETDGPIGAAAMARALDLALGARSIITVEEDNKEPTVATIRAAGCYLRAPEELDDVPGACAIDYYPLGPEKGPEHARYLVEKYKPAAIIFCEKHGPNEYGYCHTVTGGPLDKKEMANTWYLLDEAEKHGILTIGTGDGGNEIGNGLIFEAARTISKWGDKCLCGCGGGTVTTAKTDIFVAASISNWGLYGVAAMLAYLKGDVDIMHDIETERRMVEECAHYGSVDGSSMRPKPKVDGISMDGGRALVTLLREIVTNGLEKVDRHV